MATKTENKENKTQNSGDGGDAKKVDFASRIGRAINKELAEKEFGKANARAVFNAVAEAGRYGAFSDADYNGGVTLAVPDDAELRAKINEALKDLK